MIIGIYEIPGMGKIKPLGFGLKRFNLLEKYASHDLILKEGHYQHLLQYKSDAAFNSRFPKKPSKYFKSSDRASYEIRKFMMSSLSDTLMYAGEYKRDIDKLILDGYKELREHCDKVLIISHSLGSVVGYNLAHRIGNDDSLIGLVTTGCPLIEFTYDNIADHGNKWLNIWEYSDFLSNPIMRDYCKDYKWESKKFIKGATIKTHGLYNKSKHLAKLISREFLQEI